MTAPQDASESPDGLAGQSLGAARGSASWSHHKECYLQSEGGTSGWNLAWNGIDRYKATRSIETHAGTPEAARKLVARITELLNTHGE